MKFTILSLALFAAVSLTSCKSTCGDDCSSHQAAVAAVAKDHPDCTRLTLHCTPAGGGGAKACASTLPSKLGKPSDPEDLKAMQTGETVTLDEGDALDVTVPICAKDGKFMAACGVTLKKSATASKEQLVEQATAIAKAVEGRLAQAGGCCAGGCASGCCSGDLK
ncbi:MAG: hypothetical protein IT455_02160 [Planctomycetes bacterium]|nr:hypothetical protein [Planctomycetota bacterium]